MFIVIVALLVTTYSQLCKNTSDIKYELKQLTKIQGYPHQICQEYLSRTCCGSTNIDAIRASKTFLIKNQLSHQCRNKLIKLLCSPCDGDIGIGSKQGICPELSKDIYQACSNDYFIFEIHGILRPCDEDSIGCSKLRDISSTSNLKISQLFGFKQGSKDQVFNKISCFDGTSSSIKGIPKQKIAYKSKKSGSKNKPQTSKPWMNDIAQNLFISVGLLMGATIVIMKCLKRNQKDDDSDQDD